jgi:hypothetical protein
MNEGNEYMSYLAMKDAGDIPYSNLDWHIAVSFPDNLDWKISGYGDDPQSYSILESIAGAGAGDGFRIIILVLISL